MIVAALFWIISIIGGGTWERLERYWRVRSTPPGRLEVENLKTLYEAKLFDEVRTECERAASDKAYTAYAPQIMYILWATDRTTGKIDDADQIQRAFLQRFPDCIFAADMHFSIAMNRLTTADYQGAEAELAIIHSRYPSATIASKADDIRIRIAKSMPTTDPAT
jgi:outer membrane protein assembly factor BamD (BamD/ComL family)